MMKKIMTEIMKKIMIKNDEEKSWMGMMKKIVNKMMKKIMNENDGPALLTAAIFSFRFIWPKLLATMSPGKYSLLKSS